MKIQIRKSVFETNSSSTHALSVSSDAIDEVPKKLVFTVGEFGWECETYMDVETKASYIWTYLCYVDNVDLDFWKDYLTDVCKQAGVEEVEFIEPTDGDFYYIDHAYDLYGFIEDMKDAGLLKQFLFCSDSGIMSGNDNDDDDVSAPSKHIQREWYKGN